MKKTNLIKFLITMAILGVSQACFGETSDAVTQVAQSPEQTEFTVAIMKFGIVMGAVMLSSVTIFVGLSIWNAILNRSRTKTIDYEATLKEPRSVDEAILLFIQKNKLK